MLHLFNHKLLSIVDVKARDSHDQLYQIEIQLTSYAHLPAPIIYNSARLLYGLYTAP